MPFVMVIRKARNLKAHKHYALSVRKFAMELSQMPEAEQKVAFELRQAELNEIANDLRHLECFDREMPVVDRAYRPSDEVPRVQIENRGDEQLRPAADEELRRVADPSLIRPVRGELPIERVGGHRLAHRIPLWKDVHETGSSPPTS
jgi:hypothetical protein